MKESLMVIKVGGDILADQDQLSGLVSNVAQGVSNGWRIVVLHGGGPQVSAQQSRLGLTVRKVGGRRITSAEDLQVVKQVMCGELNVDLVAALQANGVNAFGCTGASGHLITAVKRPPRVVEGSNGEEVDFGEVGDVTSVNSTLLNQLLDAKVVPVLASVGITNDGEVLNINADTTVVSLARSMQADLLVLVTGVGAIFRNLADPSTRIKSLNAEQARNYIDSGVISEGMIPKVEEALQFVNSSECQVVVANFIEPGSLLALGNNRENIGTRFEATTHSAP